MKYVGDKTNEISFPLGGIGAGCIGLAGNGRLIDWEIYNRPNKGGPNGYSHFAVKAEQDGKLIDARILNGDLHSPYSGRHTTMFKGFGWGPEFENLVGMPHFRNHEFIGGYPFAKINFSDEKMPGQIALNAWSPFIPTNDRDSSLPSAIFEVEITVIHFCHRHLDNLVVLVPLKQNVGIGLQRSVGPAHNKTAAIMMG